MGLCGLWFVLLTSTLDIWMVVTIVGEGHRETLHFPRHPDIRVASVFMSRLHIRH